MDINENKTEISLDILDKEIEKFPGSTSPAMTDDGVNKELDDSNKKETDAKINNRNER